MATKATKAPLSKAEIKAVKSDLKQALLNINNDHAKFVVDHKAAEKALAVANKEAVKSVAAAEKVSQAAAAKLAKATATAEKNRAAVAAKLAELEPAKAAKPEEETAEA